MQNYLFIGGDHDGLSYSAEDDTEFVQLPAGDTDSEVYARETLSIGDSFVDIFRHESLTPEQVLSRLVQYYEAWAASRSGGRL